MRRLAVLACAAASAVAAGAEPARACSCAAQDPRRSLARADAAFIGVLVEKRLKNPHRGPIRSSQDPVIYTFRVAEAVKGRFGERVEVESAESSASCGISVAEGETVGLFLRRAGDAWQSSLCSQVTPAELRAAARPLPRPRGAGPAAVVLGGSFAPARTIALDRRGRTLSYGLGGGETASVSVCPGSRRVAELARGDASVEALTSVAVRTLPRLRRLREVPIPRPLVGGGNRFATAVSCRNARGSELLVFASSESRSLILRIRGRRVAIVRRGPPGYSAVFGRDAAYVYGHGAVDRIDLGGGRRARLLPFPADAVALSPDGRTLAAFVAQTGDVLLVDTRSQRTRRRTLSAQAMPASIVWARSAQLIVAPYGQRATTLVLDRDLRTRGRIRWGGNAVAVSGGVLYGVGYDGSVVTTPLASGTVRHAGRLPTRVVNAAAGVPRAG